jgi:hypothetical protein
MFCRVEVYPNLRSDFQNHCCGQKASAQSGFCRAERGRLEGWDHLKHMLTMHPVFSAGGKRIFYNVNADERTQL